MVMHDNLGSIIFLLSYMIIIWSVLILSYIKKPKKITIIWKLFFLAFLFLASGDFLHLIPRVYLWILYFNDSTIYESQFGISIYGLGLIATSITVSLFYLLFYYIWRNIFGKNENFKEYIPKFQNNILILDAIAICSFIIRIILIFFPQNNWGTEPEFYFGWLNFRYITNLPLYILGILDLILFLISIDKTKTSQIIPEHQLNCLKQCMIWIIISYICYTITLIGATIIPMLGMFMIPKTIAYLIVLFLTYKHFLSFKSN